MLLKIITLLTLSTCALATGHRRAFQCHDPNNCPSGDIFHCKANPCTVTHCEQFPNAQCCENYCGGCNAEFFVEGTKVNCSFQCPNPHNCPRHNIVFCKANPCQVTKCDRFPNAQCCENYCGGCNADFFVDGIKVNCSSVSVVGR